MSRKPMPGNQSPGIRIQLLDGSHWSLNEVEAKQFAMLIFYRGAHCRICRDYLKKFDALTEAFEELGVELIAVSGDSAEKAKESHRDWGLSKLRLGCELSGIQMKDWGVYVSEGVKDSEPEKFAEPALFLISSQDLKLHYAAINSMPFGRPDPGEMLEAIKFMIDESYPPRGTKPVTLTIAL